MSFKVSVLIVCKKKEKVVDIIHDVLNLDCEGIDFEIILGEGDNPSEQRNLLAQMAKGDWLLFLDDDSLPSKNLLSSYKKVIESCDLVACGGPSLLIESNKFMNNLSLFFFSSLVGLGPFRSRYSSVGKLRKSNERELILCNLVIKKDYFLSYGGFNKNLYPNEENEFIKRINVNEKIFYIPDAVVYRHPRDSISSFSFQLFNYGKGRSKSIILKKTLSDFIFLIPVFFVIYFLCLPFLIAKNSLIGMASMALYSMIVLASCVLQARKKSLALIVTPFFFFVGHFSYGAGLVVGFLQYSILRNHFKRKGLTFFQAHYFKKLS